MNAPDIDVLDDSDGGMLHDPLVNESLLLFFRWQYPDHMFIYREAFFLDYKARHYGGRYCSSALVYAMCALGSTISTDPMISCMQDVFREKAHQLLLPFEFTRPLLTSVQALLCLAFVEIGRGNMSQGWLYSGSSMTQISPYAD